MSFTCELGSIMLTLCGPAVHHLPGWASADVSFKACCPVQMLHVSLQVLHLELPGAQLLLMSQRCSRRVQGVTMQFMHAGER